MNRIQKKSNGWIFTEVLLSLGLLAMILTGLAVGMKSFSGMNRYYLARQQCLAAAQAHLDYLDATGIPLKKEDRERLWPGISVDLSMQPGAEPWSELTRVEVIAEKEVIGKVISMRLARYIKPVKEEI